MSSMSILNVYLILIVVLVIVLFVIVIVLVVFRETIETRCCSRRRDRLLRSCVRDCDSEGLPNPGFEGHERPRRIAATLPEQAPFSIMEAMETPPTYDEAIKQELFRFQVPLPDERQSSSSLNDDLSPSTNSTDSTTHASNATVAQVDSEADQNLPSTSQGVTHNSHKRSAAVGGCVVTQLSTISEEDCEEWPINVVIDCIGIQASRLIENCETSVSLANGCELGAHSKC